MEIEEFFHRHHPPPPRAKRLEFTFRWENKHKRIEERIEKGEHMQFTMPVTNASAAFSKVSVIGSPVDASGNPSKATLSGSSYTSSDPTVFTIAADPSTPNGAVITAVAAGTATLTETASATEPDGTTTETIQGVATIILTPTVIVPPPAAALVFTFGTPQ